jgi:hypothetical protein
MDEELASGREVVNLSPSQAREEAEHFLVGQGYIVRQRTATTLTVERESSESSADEQEDAPRLVVMAVPQPDGGVRIKVRGSDREGVHERQARWTEWMDSLPKRQPAPVVRVRTIPMRGSGRASGMRRLLSANVILIAVVLIALVAILALTWLAISLLSEPGDAADLQVAPQRRWASEHIRFYDLRHTCATLMLSAGLEVKYAQDRLGHADISVTMDTYTHVLPDKRAEAAKKIEEMLF